LEKEAVQTLISQYGNSQFTQKLLKEKSDP